MTPPVRSKAGNIEINKRTPIEQIRYVSSELKTKTGMAYTTGFGYSMVLDLAANELEASKTTTLEELKAVIAEMEADEAQLRLLKMPMVYTDHPDPRHLQDVEEWGRVESIRKYLPKLKTVLEDKERGMK